MTALGSIPVEQLLICHQEEVSGTLHSTYPHLDADVAKFLDGVASLRMELFMLRPFYKSEELTSVDQRDDLFVTTTN